MGRAEEPLWYGNPLRYCGEAHRAATPAASDHTRSTRGRPPSGCGATGIFLGMEIVLVETNAVN